MFKVSVNSSNNGVTGGEVVQTNWNPTESVAGGEIRCCRNRDDRHQFTVKQRGPVKQILRNMKEDGRLEMWWAVGGTAALWRKRCCGGFVGRQSLLLLYVVNGGRL